ncbi:MAG: sensor histidine kinase [Acidimicrobiia bacterium]
MRLPLAAVAALVLAILVAEIVLQPTAGDRLALVAIFATITLATAGVGLALRGFRFRSLRRAVFVVAIGSVGAAALAVALSAGLMFISPHDLRLVLVALGLGVGLGVIVAATVSGPLTNDLRAVGETARRVGQGDLSARTGIDRPDELGDAARALDAMVEALAVAQEERARLDRSRNEFLAAVSHDLRTPLQALQSATEALQDELVDDPKRYLSAMGRDIEALAGLVDGLFLLARLEGGDLDMEKAPVDMGEIVDGAAEALAPMADTRDVKVRLQSSAPAVVTGSATELSRAVRNVLENAIRHAPEHTPVDVSVTTSEGAVSVQIVDSGTGFPPDLDAFEPFAKGDSARRDGGAGLGLAIARGIAEAHGGSAFLADGPGGRVVLRLPATDRSSLGPV